MTEQQRTEKTFRFGFDPSGRFFAEDVPVAELVEAYGTPLNVISRRQLVENLRRIREGVQRGWSGPVRVLPAIKSNTSLALCRVLAAETDGCDLFSEGELEAALQSGFDPAAVSLNGNSKIGSDLSFLRSAIERGVRITLDDAAEFEPIETIATELGRRAKIRFRLRVTLPSVNAPTDFPVHAAVPTDLANQVYKAGIPWYDLVPLGRRAIESEHVEVTGLHLHFGRHRQELQFWKESMAAYARAIADLRNEWNGWEPREIDIGGGFAQHLDPMAAAYASERALARELQALSWVLRLASVFGQRVRYGLTARLIELDRKRRRAAPPPDLERPHGPRLEDYGLTAATALEVGLRAAGISTDDKLLELEPGRALYGSAAIHVVRINFLKRQKRPIPWTWAVTDTSEVWLQGGGHAATHPYVIDGKPIERFAPDQRQVADIVGKSCGPDRIIGDACLPEDLSAGDTLIFVGTGAYQEMQASNFNSMGRPATVLVDGVRHGLIRRRETIEDVFDREVIPQWLDAGESAASAPSRKQA